MSKRAITAAMKAWADYEYREHPQGLYHTCFVDGYQQGYEQAEKDTIGRAVKWLAEHAKQYVGQINEPFWTMFIKHFRKAMEEE